MITFYWMKCQVQKNFEKKNFEKSQMDVHWRAQCKNHGYPKIRPPLRPQRFARAILKE